MAAIYLKDYCGVMLIIVIYKRAVFAYNGLHGPLAQHHIAPARGPARYGDKLKPVFLHEAKAAAEAQEQSADGEGENK